MTGTAAPRLGLVPGGSHVARPAELRRWGTHLPEKAWAEAGSGPRQVGPSQCSQGSAVSQGQLL